MPYCPNCGQVFEIYPKFCTNCGSAMPVPAGPGVTPAPAQEAILGVIGGLDLKRSLLKSEPVNLVITGTRTFCVPVASLLETAKKKAEHEAKASGKWLIGTWKAKAEVTKACNFSAEFRNLVPDDIIKKFPSAIVIAHNDLVSISIRHRTLDFEGEDISSSAEDWPVAIMTRTEELSLVGKTDPIQQFRTNPAIDALLGDRIRILF